jgi:DNA-binding response OmpR family regulator
MDRLKLIPSIAIIPIIVVSARDRLENQKRALEAGAKAFLQKPVDDAELLAVIRRVLGEPAARREQPTVYDLGSI